MGVVFEIVRPLAVPVPDPAFETGEEFLCRLDRFFIIIHELSGKHKRKSDPAAADFPVEKGADLRYNRFIQRPHPGRDSK